MSFRKDEAAVRPKSEFVPKTLADLHVEGISDGLNGAPPHPPPSTGQYGRASWHASQYNDHWHAYQSTGDTFPISSGGRMERRHGDMFCVLCVVSRFGLVQCLLLSVNGCLLPNLHFILNS